MSPTGMTEEDRERLAARLRMEQQVRFFGIAKDAYTAAGVNSATWARAVAGQTITPRKQIQIVVKLWPETQGDWTKIPDLDGRGGDSRLGREIEELREAVRAAREAGRTPDEIRHAVEEEAG